MPATSGRRCESLPLFEVVPLISPSIVSRFLTGGRNEGPMASRFAGRAGAGRLSTGSVIAGLDGRHHRRSGSVGGKSRVRGFGARQMSTPIAVRAAPKPFGGPRLFLLRIIFTGIAIISSASFTGGGSPTGVTLIVPSVKMSICALMPASFAG
jgi:hypothetical protein